MASSRKSDHLENILERWFARHDLNGSKSEPSPNLSEKPVYGVAVSGGMDSMALLHALSALSSRYNFSLLALHVHHDLHLLADHWEDFCRHEAQLLGIPFWGARVQIKATGKGLEAAARQRRYEALAKAPVQGVFLAHHENDQAETLLIRLCRGSGILGLTAMQEVTRQNGMPFFRPLLRLSKASIKTYIEQEGIRYIEDPSNVERRFARNLIRHDVLPLLQSHYPQAITTIAKTAFHAQESQLLLETLARIDANAVLDDKARIHIPSLLALEEARAKNFLRFFLHQKGALPPEAKHLQEIIKGLKSMSQQAFVFTEGKAILQRGGDYLYWVDSFQSEPFCVLWQGEDIIKLPRGTLWIHESIGEGLNLEKIKTYPLTIRSRQGGEKILLQPNRPRQKVKELLRLHDVPAFLRDVYPLVYAGDTLVAIPQIAIATDWQAHIHETGLYFNLQW